MYNDKNRKNDKNIKGIIFDYGRTLQDHDQDVLMEGADEVLRYLVPNYKLAIVSVTWPETMEKRQREIREAGWDEFLNPIYLVHTAEEKYECYKKVLALWRLSGPEVAIVDDRTVRGVAWGNQHGCLTVWFQNGKFADQLPDKKTGRPDFIIHELKELKNIF